MARKKKILRTGIHYLAEIHGTKPEILGSLKVPDMRRAVSKLVRRSGFRELGRFYFLFKGGGMTGIVSLRESHIAFHTWPELRYTTLDVYTCNYQRRNARKTLWLFQKLLKIFSSEASNVKVRRLYR